MDHYASQSESFIFKRSKENSLALHAAKSFFFLICYYNLYFFFAINAIDSIKRMKMMISSCNNDKPLIEPFSISHAHSFFSMNN